MWMWYSREAHEYLRSDEMINITTGPSLALTATIKTKGMFFQKLVSGYAIYAAPAIKSVFKVSTLV